jgi:hypothetical protein
VTRGDRERDALTDHVTAYLRANQPAPLEAIAALVALCVAISERIGHSEDQLVQDVRNGFEAGRLYEAMRSKGAQ